MGLQWRDRLFLVKMVGKMILSDLLGLLDIVVQGPHLFKGFSPVEPPLMEDNRRVRSTMRLINCVSSCENGWKTTLVCLLGLLDRVWQGPHLSKGFAPIEPPLMETKEEIRSTMNLINCITSKCFRGGPGGWHVQCLCTAATTAIINARLRTCWC